MELPATIGHMLYSIGHSTLAAEKFGSLLKAHEITLLADVRSKPFSRFNPQFNRGALMGTLLKAGIVYMWYPILGDSATRAPTIPSSSPQWTKWSAPHKIATSR